MMSIQEQEERDFENGRECPYRMAMALSEMELAPDDTYKINAAIKLGMIVIADCHPQHCSRTDASLRDDRTFIRGFWNRADAEAYRSKNAPVHHEAYEGGWYVVEHRL